jgi:ParB-like chromosome segregation protein Spo0J
MVFPEFPWVWVARNGKKLSGTRWDIAQKYKLLLETPGIDSQAKLARKIGVSPARINQLLRLLKLPPSIQQSVIGMGDPLPSRKITERKLRALLTTP